MASRAGQHGSHHRKWLQLRYLLFFLALLAAGGASLGVVLYRQLHADLRLAMSFGHSRLVSPWDAVREHVIAANLGATALILLAALLLTLTLSLRIAFTARTLTRNIRDYLVGVEPEHWRPIRHPRELRHLQWLLAVGLEDHRKHVARLRLRCEQLKHALGETREVMLREGKAPDHARMRALHRRFHEVLSAYHFFKWS
jgi:hypothetical protein